MLYISYVATIYHHKYSAEPGELAVLFTLKSHYMGPGVLYTHTCGVRCSCVCYIASFVESHPPPMGPDNPFISSSTCIYMYMYIHVHVYTHFNEYQLPSPHSPYFHVPKLYAHSCTCTMYITHIHYPNYELYVRVHAYNFNS